MFVVGICIKFQLFLQLHSLLDNSTKLLIGLRSKNAGQRPIN